MVKFFLIRHATNEWVQTGRLAGWTPSVHLNDYGKQQAAALGERLSDIPLTALYASPLERTMETANAIAARQSNLDVRTEVGIGELEFGSWQGKKIKKLAKKKKWQIVQHTPSRMQFPGGETMRGAQARAVDTIERLYEEYREQKDATIAIVGHSDIIKMIMAHYLGVHLDLFQRIVISTASISVLILDEGRPFIERMNDTSHNPPAPPKPEGEDEEPDDELDDENDEDDEE